MPSQIDRLLENAYSALNDDNIDGAIKIADEISTTSADDPRLYFLRAEIAHAQGNAEAALEIVDNALKGHPDNAILQYQKASFLFDEFEEVEEAIEVLQRLVKSFEKAPQNQELMTDAYLLLGDALGASEQHSESLKIARQSARMFPEDDRVRLALATALFDAGLVDEAQKKTDEAIALDHTADDFWLLGRIKTYLGKFDEAAKAFQQATALDPENFYVPEHIAGEEFLAIVNEALKELPLVIADFTENAEVAFDDVPTPELIADENGVLSPGAFSYLEAGENFVRGTDDPWDHPPERIILFKRNIEIIARSRDDMKECVKSAIVHQISHYLA